jgi:hypothetical protein
MTSSKDQSSPKNFTTPFNRWAYGGFVLLSIYFLFINKDVASAMSNLGIALAFDPFDQRVTWAARPLYQRMWLLIHVGLTFSLFAVMLFSMK